MNAWDRMLGRFAASPAGAFWFVRLAPHIDRPLLALTGGRISMAVGQPVLLLHHMGAKTGEPRSTALVYAEDGENVILVASKGGAPRNPAWYHNLKANPEIEVQLKGRTERRRAREAGGAERDRLWDVVNDVYGGYETYQGRTGGRRIPVMVLEPYSPQARAAR
jgi:deazaflavin-dependent oxidoreductase (nitroreductase family)